MGIITLLTDFGLTDEYVGVMKGVILGINPKAKIVDLTHHIPAQSIRAASFLLKTSYAYFAPGTIHVAVVDPGVGSDRQILAVKADGHYFLAPDNGLLRPILDEAAEVEAVIVSNPKICLAQISRTFHGRDIFAPAAAHLSLGTPLEDMGSSISLEAMQHEETAREEQMPEQLLGQIVWVDHFGNLVTTISKDGLEMFAQGRPWEDMVVHVQGGEGLRILDTYSEVGRGELLALIGSRGFLEISVNMGNAQEALYAGPGARVTVSFSK
ncbi:hypothetical protein SAMN02745216_00501 [Desulfatibacillum alkenivorans DSM 16219]|jgi:S-adenosylmethionine hydrolase|uniref:Adenosyl-chloride synthase n=1 Tax=Desulfatibacillum alkenivorans DSM 16219 TaxID=1121393 RepID=A0A1M6DYW3_9BACT|nr:SAM-dependent chlorinase/fluorinase [Desulfatibacillum alkenivorans]SHI78416.1 hypothetical protein SAMN02745216_00501 [Desulfatibacillum alkenivorans DSM 16219]